MGRANPVPKPAVLRCSRCGKFVDWEQARLQVVCSCRGRVTLPPVLVRESGPDDRQAALDLFRRDFGQMPVIGFGEVVPLEQTPTIVAEMKGELAGALAYRPREDAIQIVALATDPMWQRSGVGGHLVAEIELMARARHLRQVILSTTNDNLPALYFYQRRGYQIVEVVVGGLLPFVRDPGITGFGGLPMRDEVRLRKELS